VPAATVSRVIAVPRAQVWAALSDIANARRWNASWSRIEITSKQTHGVGTAFRAHTEDGETYDFVVTVWIAPECISFSPVRGEAEDYLITLESHTFQLHALNDEETRIELTAKASARGIRGRFIAMFFWPGYQKQGLNAALDSVETLFELGEAESHAETTPVTD